MIETMPEHKKRKHKSKADEDISHNLSLKSTWITLFLASLIYLAVLTIVAYLYVNEHSERIRFFTVNTLSWLVLVAVILQVVIYRKQWHAMQDTLSEMRISRELENRAWVGVKNLNFRESPFGGHDILASFVNSGNTPAIVRVAFVGEPREDSPPDNIKLQQAPHEGSRIALFPHVEVTNRIYTLPPGHAPVTLQPTNPDHAWYLYGVLEYDDAFGRHHTTKFCYRTAAETINDQTIAVFRLASTHNTFD